MSENNTKQKKTSSGLAVAGLVLGIIAIVLSFIPIINNLAFILGAIGLVLGIVGVIKSESKVLGIIGILLCAGSIAITLYMQSAVSKAIDDATTSFNNTMDEISGDKTDEILKNDFSVEVGTYTDTEDEYGFHTTALPVTVTNISSESLSGTISIEAITADGSRITTDTVYIDSLGAGQSQAFTAFSYVSSDNLEAVSTATFNIYEAAKY